MDITLRTTPEFKAWFEKQDGLTTKRVQARLERIKSEGHFGDHKHFEGLTELRWKIGLRLYVRVIFPDVILLLGGTKHGQERDIRTATKILERELRASRKA